MLDFYSIADEDEIWQDPKEACCICSLSLEDYKALTDLWSILEKIDFRISFFEDARFFSSEVSVAVKQIEKFCDSNIHCQMNTPNRVEQTSRKIRMSLEKSYALGKGIIIFCD